MVNYDREIEKAVRDFIEDNEDILVEGVVEEKDCDRNDIRDLDELLHERFVDVPLTPADAIYILEHSDSPEDDRGLWEGQDPLDAIRTMGAFTYGRDCERKLEEVYDDIKREVDDDAGEVEFDVEDGLEKDEGVTDPNLLKVWDSKEGAIYVATERDEEGDLTAKSVHLRDRDGNWDDDRPAAVTSDDALAEVASKVDTDVTVDSCLDFDDAMEAYRNVLAKRGFKDFTVSDAPTPVEQGSEEEKRLLKRWIEMSREVGMRGGNPLGQAYIDSRCGIGLGMPDQLEFINFDKEVAGKCPHLKGWRGEIERYFQETFGPVDGKEPREVLSKVLEKIEEGAPASDFHEMEDEVRAAVGHSPSPGA